MKLSVTRVTRGVPQPQWAQSDSRYWITPQSSKQSRSAPASTGCQAFFSNPSSFSAARSAISTQLVEVLRPLMGYDREKKDLARVFQALRIEVNAEMGALRQMLSAATELLRPGGRLSILTYHSLEDRMVKNIVKAGNVEGKVETDLYGRTGAPLEAVNRSIIIPSDDEQKSNPRSRSAKLRIARKREL